MLALQQIIINSHRIWYHNICIKFMLAQLVSSKVGIVVVCIRKLNTPSCWDGQRTRHCLFGANTHKITFTNFVNESTDFILLRSQTYPTPNTQHMKDALFSSTTERLFEKSMYVRDATNVQNAFEIQATLAFCKNFKVLFLFVLNLKSCERNFRN